MLRLKKRKLWRNTKHLSQVKLIALKRLRAHEEVDLEHLKQLKREIRSDNLLKFAIAVDKDTNIILDGHHRFNALRELGCIRIPAIFVDYKTPRIKVMSWRIGWLVTKEKVVEAGLSGNKLPPKTSRHMIMADGEFNHILAVEKKVNFPLESLKS